MVSVTCTYIVCVHVRKHTHALILFVIVLQYLLHYTTPYMHTRNSCRLLDALLHLPSTSIDFCVPFSMTDETSQSSCPSIEDGATSDIRSSTYQVYIRYNRTRRLHHPPSSCHEPRTRCPTRHASKQHVHHTITNEFIIIEICCDLPTTSNNHMIFTRHNQVCHMTSYFMI